MYEEIADDWMRSPSGATGATGAMAPQTFSEVSTRRCYMGLELAGKRRRLLGGLLVYSPAFFCWISGEWMKTWLPHHVSIAPQLDPYVPTAAFLLYMFAGYAWCVVGVAQHEGQNPLFRRWQGTRIVSFRRDSNGVMRVYHPKNWQLFARAAMFVTVDISVGWLSVLLSKKNRTWGDRVAGTLVIMEGQVVPELPYNYSRNLWFGAEDDPKHQANYGYPDHDW